MTSFRFSHPEIVGCDDMDSDSGMGLIEVVIALTVLLGIFAAVGWLIITSLAASELAKQRATAGSIVAEVDAYVQAQVPLIPASVKSCSDDGGGGVVESYITARYGGGVKYYGDQGQGATKYNITTTIGTTTKVGGSHLVAVNVVVNWLGATPVQNTTLTEAFQVPCN
jgi:hypothetical protein